MENKDNEAKTYTQAELDAKVAEAATATKSRFERKYVPSSQHEEALEKATKLEAELNETKTKPQIKEAYVKAGGKAEAFNDFYAIHGKTIKLDDPETLATAKGKSSYLFDGLDTQNQMGKGEGQGVSSDKSKETEYYGNTLQKKH